MYIFNYYYLEYLTLIHKLRDIFKKRFNAPIHIIYDSF